MPRRPLTIAMLAILLLFLVPILARSVLYAMSDDPRSWRDADWSSTGFLPAATDSAPARVIIFTGTAGAWKGIFSVHSWIVLKRANEPRWQRYSWSAGANRSGLIIGRSTEEGTATSRVCLLMFRGPMLKS